MELLYQTVRVLQEAEALLTDMGSYLLKAQWLPQAQQYECIKAKPGTLYEGTSGPFSLPFIVFTGFVVFALESPSASAFTHHTHSECCYATGPGPDP